MADDDKSQKFHSLLPERVAYREKRKLIYQCKVFRLDERLNDRRSTRGSGGLLSEKIDRVTVVYGDSNSKRRISSYAAILFSNRWIFSDRTARVTVTKLVMMGQLQRRVALFVVNSPQLNFEKSHLRSSVARTCCADTSDFFFFYSRGERSLIIIRFLSFFISAWEDLPTRELIFHIPSMVRDFFIYLRGIRTFFAREGKLNMENV